MDCGHQWYLKKALFEPRRIKSAQDNFAFNISLRVAIARARANGNGFENSSPMMPDECVNV
jgi:hypothetical protein